MLIILASEFSHAICPFKVYLKNFIKLYVSELQDWVSETEAYIDFNKW